MTTAPTTYEVHGRSVAREEASIHAGNQTIPIDALWDADEPSGLPGPAELLASALAACMLKNVERSAALIPFSYESAEIDVRSRRQDAPPKFVEFEYEIRLVTNEDDRRVEMLHRNLNHYGTVYNTLAAVANVHGTIVAVKPSVEN
ncbi:OsmC family protein [Salinibacterium sp. NG253]|uniref:OsmC family protein n=1 Tax=Salinibacterium sp. NG253 TaxID=2792039 RepID=UPI0018CEEC53|nr:OsmC family protein [Salinibacterium sp. NG253]MBH0116813.1 OsmC family protein [Salinibacterium sp. NG253]